MPAGLTAAWSRPNLLQDGVGSLTPSQLAVFWASDQAFLVLHRHLKGTYIHIQPIPAILAQQQYRDAVVRAQTHEKAYNNHEDRGIANHYMARWKMAQDEVSRLENICKGTL